MTEDMISDFWLMFKEYLDKKHLEDAAERYVDLLADYGAKDETLQECLGTDALLDNAIHYYLEDDLDDDNLEEWD